MMNTAPAIELWTSEDAATFLRCDRRHFNARIKPLPGFPRPRTLPSLVDGRVTRSRPLWIAAEVRAWAAENLVESE
jgi:hypothetical protein